MKRGCPLPPPSSASDVMGLPTCLMQEKLLFSNNDKMILINLHKPEFSVHHVSENSYVSNILDNSDQDNPIVVAPPHSNKRRKVDHVDDFISYSNVMWRDYIPRSLINEEVSVDTINNLLHSGYKNNIPFWMSSSLIRGLLNKSIKNNMSKRAPRSKMMMKVERDMTKKFFNIINAT